MSLINEALRKARKEAAERDATERGVSYRPPRAHLPRPNTWLPALIGGVLLGAVVAAGAFVLLRPSNSEPQPPVDPNVTVTPEPDPNVTVTPEPTPVRNDATSPEPTEAVPNPTVISEPEQPEPSELASQPSNPTVTSEPELSASPNPTVTSEPEQPEPHPAARRVQPPERVGRVDERVYVLEADVDGVSLRLEFIVWAPSSPFAQINGAQVSVGQSVDGFLVRSISREDVTLEGDGGTFKLRVR